MAAIKIPTRSEVDAVSEALDQLGSNVDQLVSRLEAAQNATASDVEADVALRVVLFALSDYVDTIKADADRVRALASGLYHETEPVNPDETLRVGV
jgi:hypothetical protein